MSFSSSSTTPSNSRLSLPSSSSLEQLARTSDTDASPIAVMWHGPSPPIKRSPVQEALLLCFGYNCCTIDLKRAMDLLTSVKNSQRTPKKSENKKLDQDCYNQTLLLLGVLYWERGNRRFASVDVKEAIKLWHETTDPRAHFYLGRVYAGEDEKKK